MATILLCGVDLFVRGRLEAVLPEHRFTTTDGVDPPDLVIADIARIDAREVRDHEVGRVDPLDGHEMVTRQEPLELPAQEEIDADEHDRRHAYERR
jgi:hypothetical protein